MVTIELNDPVFEGPEKYIQIATQANVKDAIVKVLVDLSPLSIFNQAAMREALELSGAFFVEPIVPKRREETASKPDAWPDRLPIPEAFARWMDGRVLPKGISREQVDSAFRELYETEKR